MYPNAELILQWATLVSSFENLSAFLPNFDSNWASVIEGDFLLCQMHPDRADINKSSARLFYRIAKNHHFVDGNKRSALVALYLFIYLNSYEFDVPWEEMYVVAKYIAEAEEGSEKVIADLALTFSDFLVPKI
jgi:fido (protein-threonine AMPylation protein)